jgi:subtilase family serine protease
MPGRGELDVEAAHLIAPHAKILISATLADSEITDESTYSYGKAEIIAQEPGLLSAAAAGIPVLVATGDCGVVQNLPVASSQCGITTKMPDTAVWDDSPWVTAVGGSFPVSTLPVGHSAPMRCGIKACSRKARATRRCTHGRRIRTGSV